MSTKTKSTDTMTEFKFTKESLVKAQMFCHRCDLVSALLEDGVEYTIAEVEAMIENYLKGEVK